MSSSIETRAISIAWASCTRWAVRESADIVDVVEQPGGHTGIVLLDVQGTGSGARRLGQALTLEARSLLSGGVSPDLVTHSLNQLLHFRREGQVGATILVAAVSAARRRIEIAGYGDATLARQDSGGWSCDELSCVLAGHDPGAAPDCRILSLDCGATIVLSSDGLARTSGSFLALASALNRCDLPSVIVDGLIAAAVGRDQGRPTADMASLAIRIVPEDEGIAVERGELTRPVRESASRR